MSPLVGPDGRPVVTQAAALPPSWEPVCGFCGWRDADATAVLQRAGTQQTGRPHDRFTLPGMVPGMSLTWLLGCPGCLAALADLVREVRGLNAPAPAAAGKEN